MIATPMSVISPATRELSDADLMAAVSVGCSEALDVLIHRYGRLVYRVAVGILKDGAEAEDSTQEILFEIFRKAHLYDPERGTVRGWLLRYAYRRAIRRRVLLGRRAAYHASPIDEAELAAASPSELTPDECRWVLRSGLEQLPERQRTTLELTCFEDLTLRDVAGRLGVTVGCTRHYYYRGLAKLQQWARRTSRPPAHERRALSAAGKAGGARSPDRLRCDPA